MEYALGILIGMAVSASLYLFSRRFSAHIEQAISSVERKATGGARIIPRTTDFDKAVKRLSEENEAKGGFPLKDLI